MKRQFKERKLLKIYIEQSQFDQLKAAASFKCLSIGEFIRQQLRGLHETRFEAELRALDAVQPVARGTVAPKAEACSHKKRRGELCYKCDPKFGLPELKEPQ